MEEIPETKQENAVPVVVPLKQPAKLNLKPFIIVGILIALVGFLYFKYFNKQKTALAPVVSQEKNFTPAVSGSAPEPTLENNKAMLMAKSKITFSEIEKQESATLETLPEWIKKIMDANPKEIKVSNLVFKDGRSGVKVEYEITENLTDASRRRVRLISSPDYTFVFSSRASYFTISEFKYLTSECRITQSVSEDGSKNSVVILCAI